MLLKKLAESIGISGNEGEVRKIILEEIKGNVDEIKVDKIGNIVAYKKGKNNKKKIMVSTNIDELGLIVTEIGSTGLIKFKSVGEIDIKMLPSKRVKVGEKEILGVIGAKPIHLQKSSERKKPIDRKNLYIDIGVKSKEEAERLVSIGDYIGFESECVEFGDNLIKGKFLESRVGVSILIDLLKQQLENDIFVVFSVMKNIGLRGIGTAAFDIKPDLSIFVEGISTTEYEGSDSLNSKINIGKGPGVSLYDKRNIYDRKLSTSINEISNKNNISIQNIIQSNYESSSSKIYTTLEGIPSSTISVPIRYMYSISSVISKSDIEETNKLLLAVINNIN